jgi:hypothetical protein
VLIPCNSFQKSLHIILIRYTSDYNVTHPDSTIRPRKSPWGSSIRLAPKKDGGLRMCIDYRSINKATIRNNYSLLRIEVWDPIGGSHFFSSIELRSGYNQIRIASEDAKNFALVHGTGNWSFWWCLLVSLERHPSFSR